MPLSQAEQDFLDQYTRRLLVEWCHQTITAGDYNFAETDRPFYDYAVSKGWLSKKDGGVLSPGWKVATAFLKR